ncbi:MAG: molybdopterin-binding protein, partial [Deltaproteobacteria bacterium]|nr:molybdopterin-binding protein [Deltaproteobacteria bacterium]
KNEKVAATRAIPLVMKRSAIERAAAIARQSDSVLAVRPLAQARVGIIVTGNEVHTGLIQDRFAPILTDKMKDLGCRVHQVSYAPDDAPQIAHEIRSQLSEGCALIVLSGGMSVDPDDVTRKGIRLAGVTEIHYGAAALPGAMFLVAYADGVPLLGVPACGLYHRITVLDLILPRILAGEHVTKADLAFLGHGGLCRECPECRYPHCSFGKGL